MDLDKNCPFKVGTLYQYGCDEFLWEILDPLKPSKLEKIIVIKEKECFILLETRTERGVFFGRVLLKNEIVWIPWYGNMIEDI